MQRHHRALFLAASALLVGCGGSDTNAPIAPPAGPPAGPPGQTATVSALPSIAFSPGTVTILQGGTVTINFGSVAHNAYFDNGGAGAPANITGENSTVTKTLTFNTAGTFVYDCHIHPGMRGTVIVQPAT
jgi:plastocyanin